MKKLGTVAITALFVFKASTGLAGKCELAPFDVNNFGAPASNMYLSKDNLGYIYEYHAETDEGPVVNKMYFMPEDRSESILGVECIVVYDVEWLWVDELSRWVMLEETEDYYAWDNDGNFWYFGEETTEYLYDDNWDPEVPATSDEGSWRADDPGAHPGIILLADPQPGDCVQQEYLAGEAEDRGKVMRLNGNLSEYCDNDCLVTKEWTPLDPGNIEQKYYAPDLGLVYIKELKGKTVVFELALEPYIGDPLWLLPTPLTIEPIQ